MRISYQPYHEVRDLMKLTALVESMAKDGWVGGPIVIQGEQAITGSHRLAAAALVMDRWERDEDVVEVHVETVEFRDLFEDAGLDLDEVARDANYDMTEIVNALPASVKAEYGIDLH